MDARLIEGRMIQTQGGERGVVECWIDLKRLHLVAFIRDSSESSPGPYEHLKFVHILHSQLVGQLSAPRYFVDRENPCRSSACGWYDEH